MDNVSNAPISNEMKKALGRVQEILKKNGLLIVGDFDIVDKDGDSNEKLSLEMLSGDMYRWTKHGSSFEFKF